MTWRRKSPRSGHCEPAEKESRVTQGWRGRSKPGRTLRWMERTGQWHPWPEGQELLRTPQEDYMLLSLYACPTLTSALLATPGLWRVASTPVLHPEGFPFLAFATSDRNRYPGDGWRINYSGHEPKLSEGCQDKYVLILCSSDQEFHSQPWSI